MKLIPLSQGKFAKVSDHRYDDLMQWNWSYSRGYAVRGVGGRKNHKSIFMHRYMAGTPDDMFTDHINGDTLDNQDENPRHCDKSQNQANTGKMKRNTSGYKGVTWNPTGKKWQAQIMVAGKYRYLGLFVDPAEAARVYDDAALMAYGEFASLNFSRKEQVFRPAPQLP